jgi:hypothetical protein
VYIYTLLSPFLTHSLSLSITDSRARYLAFLSSLCVRAYSMSHDAYSYSDVQMYPCACVRFLAVHTCSPVLAFIDSRYLLQSLPHAHSLPSNPRPRSFPLFRPLSQSVQLTVDASKKELSLWTTDEVHSCPPPPAPPPSTECARTIRTGLRRDKHTHFLSPTHSLAHTPACASGWESGTLFEYKTVSGNIHPLDPVCGRLPKGTCAYVHNTDQHNRDA